MSLGSSLPARLPFSSGGNTYYVDSATGDDSRTAVQAQNPATPWATINHALDTVPLTGSIIEAEGTFESDPPYSSFAIDWSRAGNTSNPVTLKAGGGGCTITSSGGSGGGPTLGAWIHGTGATGLRIEGITFNVRGDGSVGVQIEDGASWIEIYQCRFIETGHIAGVSRGRTAGSGPTSRIRWEACEFGTSDGEPITFNGTADKTAGVDMSDEYYATQGTHFLYLGQESGDDQENDLISGTEYEVVSNCIFYGSVPGNHVQLGPQFRNGFVVNCTFYFNKWNGGNVCSFPSFPYCEYYAANGVRIWDEGSQGTYRTQDVVVANNIFMQMGGHAVGGTGGNGTVRRYVFNNIGYQCDNGYGHDGSTSDTFAEISSYGIRIFYETKPDGSAASNVVSNPQLVGPTTRDFEVANTSPAVESSILEYTPTTDFNGNARSTSAPTRGAIEGDEPTPTAPSNTIAPTFTGTATEGNTLTGTAGTWAGYPAPSLAYQWQRGSGGTYSDIGGATSSSYVLVAADVGSVVRLKVTATNSEGSAIAYSMPSSTVGGRSSGSGAPVNVTPPIISGTARGGQTLQATAGVWTGDTPMTFAFQWLRCDSNGDNPVAIGGATSATYTLVSADVGSRLRVQVTASN